MRSPKIIIFENGVLNLKELSNLLVSFFFFLKKKTASFYLKPCNQFLKTIYCFGLFKHRRPPMFHIFTFQIRNVIHLNANNDTHREKLCFARFSRRMAAWLLLTFLICLHNQLIPIHSIITY